MDASSPLLGLLANGAAAGVWTFVGLRLWEREHLPRHAEAGRAFAFAWLAGGAFAGVHAAAAALVLAHASAPALLLAAAWAALILGVAMVGSLVAYLSHLLFGGPSAVRRATYAYALLLAVLLGLMAALGPTAAKADGWTLRFTFERAGDPANALLAAVVALPALTASVAYLSLLRHACTPTARWRIVLVGGSLTVWLLTAVATRLLQAPSEAVGVVRLWGFAGALGVLLAYWPPAAIRRRWGVRSLRSEYARPTLLADRRAASREALAARVRELV